MNNDNDKIVMTLEGQEEYLYHLGSLKDSKSITTTWSELSDILNAAVFGNKKHMSESFWRRKYKELKKHRAEAQIAEASKTVDDNPEAVKILNNITETDSASMKCEQISLDLLSDKLQEIDRQKKILQDQQASYNKKVAENARSNDVLDILRETIVKYEDVPIELDAKTAASLKNKAVYAMLSDVHYGREFSNPVGKYNPEIAKERVMEYAGHIIRVAKENNTRTLYLSLMGDMINGIIHQSTRAENRENLIQQIIGVSELVAAFIKQLCKYFLTINVNSVSGNHSRIDPNIKTAIKDERLDVLVLWFVKTKFENSKVVHVEENDLDQTVATFDIGGKFFVSVHGDYDADPEVGIIKFEQMFKRKINCFLSAHKHVPAMKCETAIVIRNGAVCGSGDEYTVSRRLFGTPCQICMVVSPDSPTGVESIHPIFFT